MKKEITVLALIFVILVLLLNACKHSPDEIIQPNLPPGDTTTVCDSVNVTFAGTIWPILQKNCVGCHNSTTADNGNIDMNKYEDIARIAVSGQLVSSIEHKPGYSAMPKNKNQLSVCAIAQIKRWIADTTFAPSDTTTVCDSVNVTFPGTIWPIFQANCIGCHNSASSNNGSIDLNKYEDIARIASSGQLMGAIEHKTGYSAMPKNGLKLSVCAIAQIRRWIADTTFAPPGGIPCNPDTVYFDMDLLPILTSSCAKSNCHDAASHKEGVILTDYNNVMQTGGVNPFNPGGSNLYRKIIDNGEDIMPPAPDSPLSADQIQMVYKWIMQGAQNLHCDNMPCDTVNVTYTSTIWPIIQNNCKGCHTGANAGGGIQLVDYGTIKTAGQNGSLYGTITHSPGHSPMPKNGAMLPDCYIKQVRKWIDLGFPSK
jgi:mono/diheme cytochrome c family protein